MKDDPKVQELNDWFTACASVRNGISTSSETDEVSVTPYRRMSNDEEMYYGDVEGTGTQLTKKQVRLIDQKYGIPISSKLNYAIGEQIVSFLTGGKPYPRLIGSGDAGSDWASQYEKLLNAFWYESQVNEKLREAVTSDVAVGLGFLHLRKDHFYQESTFNVVCDCEPWTDVYIDPTSRKRDLSDAEIVIICRAHLRAKAEKMYDIKIQDDDEEMAANWMHITNETYITEPNLHVDATVGKNGNGKTGKYSRIWERIFYEKVLVNTYVSDEGDVGTKPPKPIEIPNEERAALGKEIEQLRAQGQGKVETLDGLNAQAADAEDAMAEGAEPTQAFQQAGEAESAMEEEAAQAQQMASQLQQMEKQFAQMPKMVPAYELETLTGEIVQTLNYTKLRQKKIRRTLMIGNRIMDREIMPIDEFPIIPFTFNFFRSFNRCFGLTHYIKDFVKAINKMWSQMIYDMQINAGRRMLAPEGAIMEPDNIETKWAMPGSWHFYEPNPALPDGGRPTPVDGTPLSPAIKEAISLLVELIEYASGISSLQQGQVTSATPDSAGGIQTVQQFGTQRVKLYARDIESALERFAYVAVSLLQSYAPKDKAIEYFNQSGKMESIIMKSGGEDIRFKTRVDVTSNLPTHRAMAASILAAVSGQTQNPAVADLLTKEMLRYTDIEKGEEIAEQIDTVKQLQTQIEQTQRALEDKEKELSQAKQQTFQKDLDLAKQKAIMEIEHAKDLKVLAIEMADDKGELDFHGSGVGRDASSVSVDDKI